jgi:hypothetical protein
MQTDVHFDCLEANETKIALTLNELQNSGFKICVFGTGQIGKSGFIFLKEKCFIDVNCFCDNSPSKWGTRIFELPIISPKELEKNKNKTACVVFDQISHIEIKKQIVNMGVAHLVPIDLEKKEKTDRDMEYVKTILLLQNFAPQLLKEMYLGFDIGKDIATKAAPFAFCTLRQADNESIRKLLRHLTNGIGVSPEMAFNIIQKVSRNSAFKKIAFNPMLMIAHRCPKNEKFSQSLKNLYDELYDNNINLAYVSFLLWQNKEQQALSILEKHIKKINEDAICGFLPIAEFVHRTKIMRGKRLESLAKVFSAIKNNVKNNIVKKLVAGKSIAVVGNGPQELGRKSGTKIDSHDIVVRFNRFNTNEQFVIDYGKKTDMYVFSISRVPNLKENIKIIATAQDPYLYSFSRNLQNFLIQVAPLDKFVYIGTTEVMSGIYKDYYIGGPSSGAKTIYYLKKVLKANLHKNDIFGMALSSGRVRDGEYHNDKPIIVKENCFELGCDNMYAEFEMYKHLFRNDI